MGDLGRILPTTLTIGICCLALYALVFNPKFGAGDSRTLVLTVGAVLGVVLVMVLGIAFVSD